MSCGFPLIMTSSSSHIPTFLSETLCDLCNYCLACHVFSAIVGAFSVCHLLLACYIHYRTDIGITQPKFGRPGRPTLQMVARSLPTFQMAAAAAATHPLEPCKQSDMSEREESSINKSRAEAARTRMWDEDPNKPEPRCFEVPLS